MKTYRNHQHEIDETRNALDSEMERVAPMSKMKTRKFTEAEMKAGRETPVIRSAPREPKYVPPPVMKLNWFSIIVAQGNVRQAACNMADAKMIAKEMFANFARDVTIIITLRR